MFSNVQTTQIHGGSFVQNVTNHTVSAQSQALAHQGRRAFDLLLEHCAPGALLDADERFDPPRCAENTRVAIIREILDWIDSTDDDSLMLWIHGGAGAGKSAIAQTVCEALRNRRRLLASHFFSRTSSSTARSDGRRLIPNLAYQCALFFPQARRIIERIIDSDPLILSKEPATQLTQLVVLPLDIRPESVIELLTTYLANLLSVASGEDPPDGRPLLIVVDGLDECSDTNVQRELIRVLLSSLPSFPLCVRIIILSRPESHIKNAFESFDSCLRMNRLRTINLDTVIEAREDILRFVSQEFESLKTKHPRNKYFPKHWPNPHVIDVIVDKSPSHFVFSSAVMRYIREDRGDPVKRLDAVLGFTPIPIRDRPFAALDSLYTFIFQSVEDADKLTVWTSLGVAYLHLVEPRFIPKSSFQNIDLLLNLSPGDCEASLTPLASLIIPPVSPTDTIGFFHASVFDFLLDQSRSGDLYLNCEPAFEAIAKYHRLDQGIKVHARHFLHVLDKGSDSCRELICFLRNPRYLYEVVLPLPSWALGQSFEYRWFVLSSMVRFLKFLRRTDKSSIQNYWKETLKRVLPLLPTDRICSYNVSQSMQLAKKTLSHRYPILFFLDIDHIIMRLFSREELNSIVSASAHSYGMELADPDSLVDTLVYLFISRMMNCTWHELRGLLNHEYRSAKEVQEPLMEAFEEVILFVKWQLEKQSKISGMRDP